MKCLLQGQHAATISPWPVIFILLTVCLTSCLLTGCDRPGTSPLDLATPDSNSNQQKTAAEEGMTARKTGPQPCPVAVSSPDYWDSMVPTQPGVNNVDRVTCAYMLGNTSLQALVTVRYPHAGQTLDIHIYNDITSPAPNELFQLTGLYDGDARVSTYGTLMTSEVNLDTNRNQTQSGAPVRNLSREFQWSGTAQTFIPVAFPGLYPASTRYQAEEMQQTANRDHNSWLLNVKQVAISFVTRSTFLNWQNNQINLLQGGGKTDTTARVNVINTATHNTVLLTMTRLSGQARTGIWIITSAQSKGLTLNDPPDLSSIRKPLTVSIYDANRQHETTKITILDSNYEALGQDIIPPGSPTTFHKTLAYTPLYKRGIAEGVLMITNINSADGSIIGIALFKSLLA